MLLLNLLLVSTVFLSSLISIRAKCYYRGSRKLNVSPNKKSRNHASSSSGGSSSTQGSTSPSSFQNNSSSSSGPSYNIEYFGPKGTKPKPSDNTNQQTQAVPLPQQIFTFQQPSCKVFIPVNPQDHKVDVPGLVAILDDDVYDDYQVNAVGSLTGSCIRIASGEYGIWHCTSTYEFFASTSESEPTNSITMSGPFYSDVGGSCPVIGGTGIYLGARGQIDFEPNGDGWTNVTVALLA